MVSHLAVTELGLVGVGVMGRNLALNLERNGFPLALYDRQQDKVQAFLSGEAQGKRISGAASAGELMAKLERPRRIVLLVDAGTPVDDVIDQLKPHWDRGDVVIDGGNSFFRDTERRSAALAHEGIHFVGLGISGGAEGALKGPALMAGGSREGYDLIAPVLTRIAARVDGEPCCAYMGPRGAGHYVKMVHNGIEYGILQLIGEAYDILRSAVGLPAGEIARCFEEWGQAGDLSSYLFEITAKVLRKVDSETGTPLVDLILDVAGQKGTGIWTSQNSYDLGTPIPAINAAVEARMLSSLKTQRQQAAKVLHGGATPPVPGASDIDDVRDALHASVIVTYAQGMSLMQAGSAAYGYELDLSRIASVWRGGCIIRSQMIEPIRAAFAQSPALPSLMLEAGFAAKLNSLQTGWRRAMQLAIGAGIPVLATGASLSYYDAYRCERLPANLLQAQRDFFGAHTYRRIDSERTFHTQWEE